MSSFTQNSFYLAPKERIANLLDLPSSFEPEGYLVCKYNSYANIVLYDYVIPEHVVRSPEMQAYVGMMGTRAEVLSDYRDDFGKAKAYLDNMAKEYEI